MKSVAQQVADRLIANESVTDESLKDWINDKVNSLKVITGIGHDSLGNGKNTEKDWKPSYRKQAVDPEKIKKQRKERDGNTWKLE